jgi:hypothetical protein
MNDEQLRSRIAASDPMLDGIPTEPTDSPSARTLLEAIMSTELDTDTSGTSGTSTTPTTSTPGSNVMSFERRRKRWAVAALGAAAVGALALAGAVVGGAFDDDEPNVAVDPPAVEDPTVLELSGGETDPMMMSCLPMDATIISQSPVAFRGIADTIDGDVVTLTVDEWYQGGDADVVTITAPLGMEALIGGIAFEPGQPYLVSAYDGVVSYCGMSGPATPELQQMYDDAFAR